MEGGRMNKDELQILSNEVLNYDPVEEAKSEERQRILKIIEPIRQDLSDLIDKLYCGEKKEVSEETFDILVKIHDKIELLSKFIEV